MDDSPRAGVNGDSNVGDGLAAVLQQIAAAGLPSRDRKALLRQATLAALAPPAPSGTCAVLEQFEQLLVVARGVQETGALERIVRVMLGAPTSTSAAQARMMVPVVAISGFLSNTACVAMMIPIIDEVLSLSLSLFYLSIYLSLSLSASPFGACKYVGCET